MGVKKLRTESDADNRFNIANANWVGCFHRAPQKASLHSLCLQNMMKLFRCHHFSISYFMQAQWGPWELGLRLFIAGGRLGRDHFNEAWEECLRSPCDKIIESRGWRSEGWRFTDAGHLKPLASVLDGAVSCLSRGRKEVARKGSQDVRRGPNRVKMQETFKTRQWQLRSKSLPQTDREMSGEIHR